MFERFKSLSRRTKTAIWAILILLLLLIGILIYLQLRQSVGPEQPLSQETVTPQPGVLPPQISDAGVIADIVARNGVQEDSTDAVEQNISLFASSFIERYGSFSNQSGFKSFDDLDSFMTASFRSFVEVYRSDLEAQHGFDEYYGIETKVISSSIQRSTDTTSTVLLKTQRQEFTDAFAAPRVYYQDVRLELIRSGAEWLVQGVYWQ